MASTLSSMPLAWALAANMPADDAAFADAYRALLRQVQSQMGAPGYAPVASLDTARADEHRCRFVRERWGQAGAPPATRRVAQLETSVGEGGDA